VAPSAARTVSAEPPADPKTGRAGRAGEGRRRHRRAGGRSRGVCRRSRGGGGHSFWRDGVAHGRVHGGTASGRVAPSAARTLSCWAPANFKNGRAGRAGEGRGRHRRAGGCGRFWGGWIHCYVGGEAARGRPRFVFRGAHREPCAARPECWRRLAQGVRTWPLCRRPQDRRPVGHKCRARLLGGVHGARRERRAASPAGNEGRRGHGRGRGVGGLTGGGSAPRHRPSAHIPARGRVAAAAAAAHTVSTAPPAKLATKSAGGAVAMRHQSVISDRITAAARRADCQPRAACDVKHTSRWRLHRARGYGFPCVRLEPCERCTPALDGGHRCLRACVAS